MNHIFLTGRLTDNPKVTTLASGKDKADFRIAVNRDYAKADGTREVDFFNCVAWSGMAGFCGKYLYKGQRIAIEGRMQTRSYTAEDGSKRWVYEVNIERIEPQEWKKTEEVQEKPEDG